MFYSAMTVSAAKQISLFTTGSHLRDKSLNVGLGMGGEGWVGCSGGGCKSVTKELTAEIKLLIKLRVV